PAPDVAASPARRIRWQWSVTTLLLLTAVVAAWVGWWQVRKQSVRLRSQIQAMQRLQRRLVIDDPQQFAIIEEHETWYDEDRWQGISAKVRDARSGREDASQGSRPGRSACRRPPHDPTAR